MNENPVLTKTIFSNLGCPYPQAWIGNNICNDQTNNVECNYDGGDCCIDMNNEYCTDCTCYLIENCAAGFTPSVVGNGFCNDETNNEICNYDGGDCCGSCVLNSQCIQCACLGGVNVTNILIGNAVCNEETNIADCNYDGGDCCKSFIVLNFTKLIILSLFQFLLSCLDLRQFVKQNMTLKKTFLVI